MTDTADTTGNAPDATGSAPGAELSIPKYRFDEAAAEVRRLREEVAMKDRLYMEDRQRFAQANQSRQVEPELNAEEFGLDPQSFQGIKKVAERIAGTIVKQERAVFEQQIGILANRTEKAELLASKGSAVAKHIPEIQRQQQEHFNRTGTFMPAEIAYELIKSKENEEKIRVLEARLAGKDPNPSANASSASATNQSHAGTPSAAGTRQMPSGGAANGSGPTKSYSELSLEEMEAQLEEKFKQGSTL